MNINHIAIKNDTLKSIKVKYKASIKNTIKLFIVFWYSLFLISCVNGYNQKPDNKLKKSPCACNGIIYDSRVVV